MSDNVAVDHIDLAVPAGSFFGLVGPNGAGKTTSLSMAVGLLRPDGGTVRIFGRDVWADPVAAKAWFLVTGPAGFLLTVVLTAASGQTWSWPWVLAAEPALVIGSAGLLALIGVRSVNGPAPDGGPNPARVLKTHIALIVLPVVTLAPAIALLIAGTASHDLALRWLAVPVGLAWAAFLCWRSVRLAQQRLESHGPEIFTRLRAPAS
jgi:energy-coupling factor transporter ATP-binding protein EcfA2